MGHVTSTDWATTLNHILGMHLQAAGCFSTPLPTYALKLCPPTSWEFQDVISSWRWPQPRVVPEWHPTNTPSGNHASV